MGPSFIKISYGEILSNLVRMLRQRSPADYQIQKNGARHHLQRRGKVIKKQTYRNGGN